MMAASMMRSFVATANLLSRRFQPQVYSSLRPCTGKSNDFVDRAEVKKTVDDIDQILQERAVDLPVPDFENPYKKEEKICILCKHDVQLDYKNTKLLSQFISPHTGKVYNKNITGLCTQQYERVVAMAKKAKEFGYMPYVHKDVIYLKDYQLIEGMHTPIKRH